MTASDLNARSASVILGLGTGRCGTHSLTDLLNLQTGAEFTHEEWPLLPWNRVAGRPGIGERLRRLRRTRAGRYVGDVASFYLPYAEQAIALDPKLRMICLERPREEVVASFCRWLDTVHPLPTDHWSRSPAPGWYHEPFWSRIFPRYDVSDRGEGIRRYWEDYHQAAAELARRFPQNFRVFPTHEALNTDTGVRDLLTFAGIPEDRQVVRVGVAGAGSESTPVHPRRDPATVTDPVDPKRCVVLVPQSAAIVPACERALKELEGLGYEVRRDGAESSGDMTLSQMATDALLDGFRETLWIGADISFEPDAVGRLRGHGEAMVGGLYPLPGQRHLACEPLPGTEGLLFGAGGGLHEISFAGLGFLLVRRQVYMDVQRRLDLPVCNEANGRPLIPFFQPLVAPTKTATAGWRATLGSASSPAVAATGSSPTRPSGSRGTAPMPTRGKTPALSWHATKPITSG